MNYQKCQKSNFVAEEAAVGVGGDPCAEAGDSRVDTWLAWGAVNSVTDRGDCKLPSGRCEVQTAARVSLAAVSSLRKCAELGRRDIVGRKGFDAVRVRKTWQSCFHQHVRGILAKAVKIWLNYFEKEFFLLWFVTWEFPNQELAEVSRRRTSQQPIQLAASKRDQRLD